MIALMMQHPYAWLAGVFFGSVAIGIVVARLYYREEIAATRAEDRRLHEEAKKLRAEVEALRD